MRILFRFLLVFVLIFIFYLLFTVFNKKKRRRIFETTEAKFLKLRFKIKFKDYSEKKFALIIAATNSFICAATFVIMSFIDNILISFVVAIPVLLALITILYTVLGLVLKKKEVKKNV